MKTKAERLAELDALALKELEKMIDENPAMGWLCPTLEEWHELRKEAK